MNNLKEAVEYWNRKQQDDLLQSTQVGSPQRHRLSVGECQKLLKYGMKPGARVKFYGFEAEITSDPFPSKYGASINVREPGKPDTIVEAAVNPGAFKLLAA